MENPKPFETCYHSTTTTWKEKSIQIDWTPDKSISDKKRWRNENKETLTTCKIPVKRVENVMHLEQNALFGDWVAMHGLVYYTMAMSLCFFVLFLFSSMNPNAHSRFRSTGRSLNQYTLVTTCTPLLQLNRSDAYVPTCVHAKSIESLEKCHWIRVESAGIHYCFYYVTHCGGWWSKCVHWRNIRWFSIFIIDCDANGHTLINLHQPLVQQPDQFYLNAFNCKYCNFFLYSFW